MTVPNTPVGAQSAIPIAPGGIGTPLQAFMLVESTSFVCNGATPVTVAAPNVTANSAILPTLATVGGTVGAIPAVKTITPGTGFTIAGTASDTSTYNLLIFG